AVSTRMARRVLHDIGVLPPEQETWDEIVRDRGSTTWHCCTGRGGMARINRRAVTFAGPRQVRSARRFLTVGVTKRRAEANIHCARPRRPRRRGGDSFSGADRRGAW